MADIKTSPDHRARGQVNQREDVRRRKGKDQALEESQQEVDDRRWGDGQQTGGKGPGACGQKRTGREGKWGKRWPEEASVRGLAGIWLGHKHSLFELSPGQGCKDRGKDSGGVGVRLSRRGKRREGEPRDGENGETVSHTVSHTVGGREAEGGDQHEWQRLAISGSRFR